MKKHSIALLVVMGLFSQVAMAEEVPNMSGTNPAYIGMAVGQVNDPHVIGALHPAVGILVGAEVGSDSKKNKDESVVIEASYLLGNGDSYSATGGSQTSKLSKVEIDLIAGLGSFDRSHGFLSLGIGQKASTLASSPASQLNNSSGGGSSQIYYALGAGANIKMSGGLRAQLAVTLEAGDGYGPVIITPRLSIFEVF